jgi:hypothetical protein
MKVRMHASSWYLISHGVVSRVRPKNGTMVTLHKIVLSTGRFYVCGDDLEDERSLAANSSWRGRLQRQPRAYHAGDACSAVTHWHYKGPKISPILGQMPISTRHYGWVYSQKYRGYWLGPRTLWEGSISSSRHTIHTGTVSTCTWCPYLPCCTWKTAIQIVLTSKRTSAQSESPTPFLGFWVSTKTIHAISPWFRRIAQQPRNHSEAHC